MTHQGTGTRVFKKRERERERERDKFIWHKIEQIKINTIIIIVSTIIKKKHGINKNN